MPHHPHVSEFDLSALSRPDRAVGAVALKPRGAVYAGVGAAAVLGWLYLALMAVGGQAPASTLGPGMQLLDGVAWLGDIPLLEAICRPLGLGGSGPVTPAAAAVVVSMWVSMAVTMMLPSAAPMLATYAVLADTAARKGEPAAPVRVLAAGYLAVWTGFAVAAAALQIWLHGAGVLTDAGTPASRTVAGIVLLAAALYQFTPAKHACLIRCRNPFPFFFSHWTASPAGVFRIGLSQGLFCLGCCWALMTVMFAVGVMNLLWIALLCGLMVIEKTMVNPWVPRLIGGFLAALAIAVLAPVVAAAVPPLFEAGAFGAGAG